MTPDPLLSLAHLQLLFQDAPEGFVAVSHGSPLQSEFFPVDDLDLIAKRCSQLALHGHVYVAGGLLAERPQRGRGKADDVAWIRVAALDFDVGSEGHKAGAALPRDRADLRRLLHAVPEIPDPCMVVETGNGLLALWQLEEPLSLQSAADRARAAALLEAFQGRLRSVARETFGWRLDKTSDLARLLRLAGTFNWKSAPPKPVRLFQ